MRRAQRVLFFLVSFFVIAGVAACGGGLLYSFKGATVRPGYEIPIILGGRHSGRYQSRDVTVSYEYETAGDVFKISGTVLFESHLTMNFVGLHYFNLSLFFADENNRVLEHKSLVSAGWIDGLRPVSFKREIRLPEHSSIMAFAFAYTGEVGGGGESGGPSDFWEYPVKR